ncbi:MAG TPA: hypothetical protein VJ645_06135, partial [Gaiellaceae bacterium]|nr:hypothetical protein [Gaiellaceae bacterium]
PVTAFCVWVASILALFATPALERTFDYYRDLLQNEAASRGVGLWEPVDPSSPVGLLLIAAAAALLVLALWAKPRLWELVVLAGLVFLTIRTARSGVWLLFAAAGPAAAKLPMTRTPRALLAGVGAILIAVLILIGLARGPIPTDASSATLAKALSAAGGTPILAEPALAEQVAGAGGRVWIGNPLDAFPLKDQRLYLDWVEGQARGEAAIAHAPRVVLVNDGSDAEQLVKRVGELREIARDDIAVVYSRTR